MLYIFICSICVYAYTCSHAHTRVCTHLCVCILYIHTHADTHAVQKEWGRRIYYHRVRRRRRRRREEKEEEIRESLLE